jgi:MFS superfamily sulfate permease-like transporter
MLGLSTLDHFQLPADGTHSMRQTSRVIPPLVEIASVTIIKLPLVALDAGDRSSRELVSNPELSALGPAGHQPAARRLLNPSCKKFEP